MGVVVWILLGIIILLIIGVGVQTFIVGILQGAWKVESVTNETKNTLTSLVEYK